MACLTKLNRPNLGSNLTEFGPNSGSGTESNSEFPNSVFEFHQILALNSIRTRIEFQKPEFAQAYDREVPGSIPPTKSDLSCRRMLDGCRDNLIIISEQRPTTWHV